ncbi:RNA methyltransferase, partial [Mycobacterium tuberculosis]
PALLRSSYHLVFNLNQRGKARCFRIYRETLSRFSCAASAVAWRTSAGAAARIPVARATNLTRTLKGWADRGVRVIGLDAGGGTALDDVDGTDSLVVVVGSEGKGLSRLVRQNCDEVVSIPMAAQAESLNASVAAGVVLAEIARQRRRPREPREQTQNRMI